MSQCLMGFFQMLESVFLCSVIGVCLEINLLLLSVVGFLGVEK